MDKLSNRGSAHRGSLLSPGATRRSSGSPYFSFKRDGEKDKGKSNLESPTKTIEIENLDPCDDEFEPINLEKSEFEIILLENQ